MAPAARFVVNGVDGDLPVSVSRPGFAQDLTSKQFYTQAGSGSGPATVIIGIDGPFVPLDIAAHVEAYPGETFYQGTHMAEPSLTRVAGGTHHSHFKALSHQTNMAPICSRVLYMPARAKVQEKDVGSIFSSLAISRQKDGLIRLIPMDDVITSDPATHPSDGNPGDIAVWQLDLDGTNAEPPTWIMNDKYTWVPLDWSTAANDYFDKILIYRKTGGTISILLPTRPVGYPAGTHWMNSSNGTEWILGVTAAEDEPYRAQGVPVGDELIENGNFSQGSKNWIFTRNANLKPVNVYQALVDSIAQAFIAQGTLEGEFGDPLEITETASSSNVLPLVSMNVTVSGDDQLTVSWEQQIDDSSIDRVELSINATVLTGVTTSPHVITGLQPGTAYSVQGRNVGTNGNRSTMIAKNATTSGVGSSGQLGIAFTDTGSTLTNAGRRVAGTARENNAPVLIQQGRAIFLTLNNGHEIESDVGAGGEFVFYVPTPLDGNLNKSAFVYANNGTDATRSQAEFLYETGS